VDDKLWVVARPPDNRWIESGYIGISQRAFGIKPKSIRCPLRIVIGIVVRLYAFPHMKHIQLRILSPVRSIPAVIVVLSPL